MNLELIILTPDHQTRRVPLVGASVTLGRAHSNDLCYAEDASLSRRHMQFVADDEGWWVEDLGSKNGTLLNGVRISRRQKVKPGDRFSVGHLTIRCIDSDDETGGDVVFVPEPGPETRPDATVVTSLEGLLSGDETAPPREQGRQEEARSRGRTFDSPVVRALVRAGRELAGDTPLDELFPLILDLSISAVGAERGVVMTIESGRLISRAMHGDSLSISTTVRDRVLQEKTSLLVRNLNQDEAFRKQISISEQQIHTMMAVPLQTEDRVIGLIYVDSRSFVREFTPDDLNLLTVLANVAAIRIEHRRFAELEREEQRRTLDMQQAAEIQRNILPRGAPEVPGLELAGHNAPSRMVGGDYYDFIPYPDGRVTVVLGDVAGKGMSAALLMSNLQARVQLLTATPADLSEVMGRLDRSLSINCPSNRFITLFLALLDPPHDRLTYCNAGHNPPLLIRSAGQVERLRAASTVLGILPQVGYTQQDSEFRRGDLLAIYSDGVTESESPGGEEYGEQRLAELLGRHLHLPATDLLDLVLESLNEWTAGAPAVDDLTLLLARRTK